MSKAIHIVQISDLHLLPGGGDSEFGVPTEQNVKSLFDTIRALPFPIDAIVATGDLADCGNAGAYRSLSDMLCEFSTPHFVIPGNVDDRQALRKTFPLDGEDCGDAKYCHRYSGLSVEIFFLDTSVDNQHFGRLGTEQLAWLDRMLREVAGKPAVLFMHHPPIRVGLQEMDDSNLHDSDDLAGVLERHTNVVHMACGHLHRSVFSVFAGIPVSVAPSPTLAVTLALGEHQPFSMCEDFSGFNIHRWECSSDPKGQWTVHGCALGAFRERP